MKLKEAFDSLKQALTWAPVLALPNIKQYMMGKHFIIKTGHQPLKYFWNRNWLPLVSIPGFPN